MAPSTHEEHLRCPFCRYDSGDFNGLDMHVRHSHPNKQYRDDIKSYPDSPRPSETSELNDFQLAQLLAFQEAGLPSELALSESPSLPAGEDGQPVETETARKHASPQSSSRAGDEEPWVGCVCGERVHFLELDAHADMHAQENVSMDDSESPSNPQLSTPSRSFEHALADVSGSFNTNIPNSLRNHGQLNPKTPPSSNKRRVPSLREIFLGTPASPKRKSPYKAVSSKKGKTKRLGVS